MTQCNGDWFPLNSQLMLQSRVGRASLPRQPQDHRWGFPDFREELHRSWNVYFQLQRKRAEQVEVHLKGRTHLSWRRLSPRKSQRNQILGRAVGKARHQDLLNRCFVFAVERPIHVGERSMSGTVGSQGRTPARRSLCNRPLIAPFERRNRQFSVVCVEGDRTAPGDPQTASTLISD